MKNLLIIYRTYAGETEKIKDFRPEWFSKFKCFKSLWNEFGNRNDVDFCVVWDNGGVDSQFAKYILNFVPISYYLGSPGSNFKSLMKCYETGWQKSDSYKFIFHLEDDYLMRSGCYETTMEALTLFNLYTPYESPDRYNFIGLNNDVSWGREYIFKGKQCYYRSVESTTGSVIIKSELLKSIYQDFIDFNVNDRKFYRNLYKKGIRLCSSMPGFMTHCVVKPTNCLSPFVNWEEVSNNIVL